MRPEDLLPRNLTLSSGSRGAPAGARTLTPRPPAGAAGGGGLSQRQAHAPGRPVAEDPDAVERLARAAGGDEHLDAAPACRRRGRALFVGALADRGERFLAGCE